MCREYLGISSKTYLLHGCMHVNYRVRMGECVTMSLCLWHLQPVPLGTGALIVSTHVIVTTEPSAVPTMGSAGAAPAGPDSTVHSVSLFHPVSRHTLSSTGSPTQLQQMTNGKSSFSLLTQLGKWMILTFHIQVFFFRGSKIKIKLMVTSLFFLLYIPVIQPRKMWIINISPLI